MAETRAAQARTGPARARADRGYAAHRGGAAAEDAVARRYQAAGREIAARRWRGPWGEIDLIARQGDEVIFVEVKSGRTHAEAAARLCRRQQARVMASAAAFLDGEPAGQFTPVRFDLALVDSFGRIDVIEGAFGA